MSGVHLFLVFCLVLDRHIQADSACCRTHSLLWAPSHEYKPTSSKMVLTISEVNHRIISVDQFLHTYMIRISLRRMMTTHFVFALRLHECDSVPNVMIKQTSVLLVKSLFGYYSTKTGRYSLVSFRARCF